MNLVEIFWNNVFFQKIGYFLGQISSQNGQMRSYIARKKSQMSSYKLYITYEYLTLDATMIFSIINNLKSLQWSVLTHLVIWNKSNITSKKMASITSILEMDPSGLLLLCLMTQYRKKITRYHCVTSGFISLCTVLKNSR